MNIRTAKALAGLPQGHSIRTRQGVEAALRAVKAAIVAARRAGDDAHAAVLSTAKETFRQRLSGRNLCATCGVTIGRKATHCALHQQGRGKRLLPGPPSAKRQPPAPRARQAPPAGRRSLAGNPNARVDVAPVGGLLARLGYYSAAVVEVRKRWPAVREDVAARLFVDAAMAVLGIRDGFAVRPASFELWQCACEFGAALARTLEDKRSPTRWLLLEASGATDSGDGLRFPSWAEIAARIARSGGPRFSAGTLQKTAARLRLVTPDALRRDWLQSRPVTT